MEKKAVVEAESKPVRRRKKVAEEQPQPEPKPAKKARAPKVKEPNYKAIVKAVVKLVHKHCIECNGGSRECKIVLKDGKHVLEPGCTVAHCFLHPIIRGEIDYE